jgi:NADPH:quinone reductase-like Zn-dependent oxidoreductase
VGARVKDVREGDIGAVFGASKLDKFGYMIEAHAYDAPNTVGLLAKRSKIKAGNLMPLPAESPYSYKEWAAFIVRYVTAWSNWKVAYGAYRLQISEEEDPAPYVWGWGGGSTLAEVDLARRQGCRVAMISGSDAHLETIRRLGILGVDRRLFPNIAFDEKRWATDPAYKAAYRESEEALLEIVMRNTERMGAAIFIDFIGSPVLRVTLKALARQGVLATAGWLLGMSTSTNRAIECIKRHVHVHTHYARHADWFEASRYAVRAGWMPTVTEVYGWDELERLARNAAAGIVSYFPVYEVNPI